jgi:glutamate racemase
MIGVFDSGVGGLSVVKEIIKALPSYKIIYFGDTARLPYGTKGTDFVKKYSEKITNWLLDKGAEIIVIACHTSSAQAGDFLKNRFKNIPIFDMITPCEKELSFYKKIGIIGTPGTIKSRAWERHILNLNPNSEIKTRACPLFVPLVEEGWLDNKASLEISKEYLKDFEDIDALVLACTHYPMLENIIKKSIKGKIVDPAKILAKKLAAFVSSEDIKLKSGKNEFYFSDTPYNLDKISKLVLNKKINPIINDPF